ncbi:MAG TPA: hypothetical protein ENH12_04090, partial [Proteobacteria bacterium]|nr:hypothetical protein [Pseudomonadota bacterium]
SSWTLPAHMSLFTSMDIMTHGVGDDGNSLHKDISTLPMVFKNNGYRTAAFCSSPYLNPAFGYDRGFDLYYNIDLDDPQFEDTVRPPHEQWDAVQSAISSPRITDLACDWLEENSSGPFFLFVHMFDVHYDYNPPEPYDRKFDPDYTGDIDCKLYITDATADTIYPDMAPRDLAHVIALYDGEIAYVDYHLGLIIEKLKELGIFEQTLIVITADHGDEFFEHGKKGHGNSLFDEVIKIPLIFHCPEVVDRGGEIDNQVGIIDIAPSILDLCGLNVPGWMQGRSLLPLIQGKSIPDDECVLLDLRGWRGDLKALRTNSYKLIFNTKSLQTIIYDLVRDPEESGRDPVIDPARWSAANNLFHSRMEDDHLRAKHIRGNQSGEPVQLSEKDTARLKTLGYLGRYGE